MLIFGKSVLVATFAQRWIYKTLVTPGSSFVIKCQAHGVTNVPKALADERKMHFTCARGGNPGA